MNQQPDKLLPAVYGGIIMGLLSAVPFVSLINCLCCAGILAGGVAAVFFYKSNFTPDTPPFTSADCLLVGALSGVVGAVVGTVLSLGFTAMFGNVMMEFLRNVLLNPDLELPEQSRAQLEELLVDKGTSPILIAMNFFFSLILDVIFGLLGGLIGYGIFKPKAQGMPPMPKPV